MDTHTTKDSKKEEGFLGQKKYVLPPDAREKISNDELIQNLFLTAIGYYPNASFHDLHRENGSKEYIILYCIKGEGEIVILSESQKLTPNSFIIIPPFVPHFYRSSLDNPWSIYWVHFTGNHADALYQRYSSNLLPHVKRIAFQESRLKIFDKMFTFMEGNLDIRNLEIANMTLYNFLLPFIYDSDRPLSTRTNRVDDSISFMKSRIKTSLKINELASQQNLSISRFSELFKEETGMPPIQYFIQLKVQQSCQYLYFTDLNVKEICLKMGFDDPYYFSRIFKKFMGVSPSKYRSTYKK